jgi:hypothetical protein
MPDPNSVSFAVTGAATTNVIATPAATTTLYPQPPYPLGFIRVLGIELTGTATGIITIKSTGSTGNGFADRTLDTIQCVAGVPIILQDATGAGFGGQYDCDPGAALTIINTAGNISGHVRYTVLGVP